MLNDVKGLAVDASGNLYIADYGNKRIRKVSASTGVISTIAGNGNSGYSGNGGLATSAALSPDGIAVDASGNLFIADYDNHCIRKVSASTGIINTVAGTGSSSGNISDGIAATSAILYYPKGVSVDASGNLYITSSNKVYKVNASTGIITTIAGSDNSGYSGDGGIATLANLNRPYGVAVDGSGNVYVADNSNQRVRKITYIKPSISFFTPIAVSSGVKVTIKGNLFTGATAVSFGGTAASSFTVVNDSTITAVVGAGASGNISVTTAGGTATLSGFGYCTPAISKPITLTSCNSVLYKSKTYTLSTIVRDTVRSVRGCDSIYNVATITVYKVTAVTKTVTYTGCGSVLYNGRTYAASTVVRDTVRSVQGCDSVYNVVTITITPITPTTVNTALSGCKSVVYNGITYTASTTKTDTLKSVGGCDSVYNVATITITSITPTSVNVALSGCKSVVYNGITYTASTTKTDTLKSIGGCDSVYKVATITIKPITVKTVSTTLSGCKTVVYKTKTYTALTVVRDTVRSVGGCDSVYNVATITIKPITVKTVSIPLSGCNSVVYKSKLYRASTVVRDTVKSVGGCDSIYNVATITITPITPTTINTALSGCSSVLYNGITYTATTIKRDTTKSVGGCDSIYNVATITINIPMVPTITTVGKNPLCAGAGDSLALTTTSATAQWIRNNSVMPGITGAKYVAKLYGSYTVVFTDANGCMAKSAPVVVNELFVPAPTIAISYGSVLTSSYDDGNQWYKDYNTLVATSKTYSQLDTSVVAQYSVQAVVNGCKSPMSNPIVNTRDSLNSININCPTVVKPTTFATPDVMITYEGAAPLKVNLYPNPTSSSSYVQVTGASANAVISISDVQGKTIWKTTIGSSKTITLPAGTLASGVYIVSVISGNQHEELKWVINR